MGRRLIKEPCKPMQMEIKILSPSAFNGLNKDNNILVFVDGQTDPGVVKAKRK